MRCMWGYCWEAYIWRSGGGNGLFIITEADGAGLVRDCCVLCIGGRAEGRESGGGNGCEWLRTLKSY